MLQGGRRFRTPVKVNLFFLHTQMLFTIAFREVGIYAEAKLKYKLIFVQQFTEMDYGKHDKFAVQMLQYLKKINNVLIFMSDEAQFQLSENVSKQSVLARNNTRTAFKN